MRNSVLQFFEETSCRLSSKIAITDKRRELSFGNLRHEALSVAQYVLNKKDAKCCPIAIYLPKSIESVVSLLGVLYSGNFYVPLDTKAPVARLKSILNNLSPVCVITDNNHKSHLIAAGFNDNNIIIIEDEVKIESSPDAVTLAKRWQSLIDTDPVYIIYTSGSTGAPKGVAIPHRGVIDYINWANCTYDISENDVIGSQAPFFFDNSTLDLYLCFSRGAKLHLIPEELFAFPIKLVEHLCDYRISTIFWVPSIMTAIANFDILASVRPKSLKNILFAGEVMPARTLNYWRQHIPSALFSNLYGPTEITVDCTYYIIDREIADDEPVPIGFPCRNSDVLILNEQNQIVADGVTGELCVRGSSLALGYWNDPDKTQAVFVQNPLRNQYPERIYRTGDLVHRNALGEIIYLGRKDSQIKHQGYRIELGEIETIAGLLEGVRSVCVLYNHLKQEITLFYEAATELPVRELREQMSRYLPRYMLPALFVFLPSMPKNANGKTDRIALSQKYF